MLQIRNKKLLFICIFLLSVLVIIHQYRLSTFCCKFSEIPAEDRDLLQKFFYRILYKEGFIYVLCGSKPMGTACYTSSLVSEMDKVPTNQMLKNGWKSYLKYQHLFSNKKMLFRIVGNEKKDCTIKILLINKINFKETILKHRSVFESTLGSANIDEMLGHFERDEDPIESVLKHNHLLIGILHGFGVHNSQYFLNQWEQIEKIKNQFGSQREMCEKIRNLHTETLETEVHPVLNLPVFMADPSNQETIDLRNRYEKERVNILRKFNDKDLLEIVINEWK